MHSQALSLILIIPTLWIKGALGLLSYCRLPKACHAMSQSYTLLPRVQTVAPCAAWQSQCFNECKRGGWTSATNKPACLVANIFQNM